MNYRIACHSYEAIGLCGIITDACLRDGDKLSLLGVLTSLSCCNATQYCRRIVDSKLMPWSPAKDCTNGPIDTSVEACIEEIPWGGMTVVYDRYITSTSERSDPLSVAAGAERGPMGVGASPSALYSAGPRMAQNCVSYTKGAMKHKTNQQIKFPEDSKLTAPAGESSKETHSTFWGCTGCPLHHPSRAVQHLLEVFP